MRLGGARSGGRLHIDNGLADGLTTLLCVAVAAVVYFVIPVPGRMRESSWIVLFAVGLLVLALLIVLRIQTLLHATEGVRARGLIVLLSCTVLWFAYSDVTLAAIPGEFSELHTKIDAIYFCIGTLATVGFGDVHAAGQLARAAVTLQVIFNLVFLGTAVTFVTGILRQRVQTSRQQLQSGNAAPPDSSGGPADGAPR
jgi:voltage-gated potassium channel